MKTNFNRKLKDCTDLSINILLLFKPQHQSIFLLNIFHENFYWFNSKVALFLIKFFTCLNKMLVIFITGF